MMNISSEDFCEDLRFIGSINGCVYILVYLIISIDYLLLVDVYRYNVILVDMALVLGSS
jgi:hypothetical protein